MAYWRIYMQMPQSVTQRHCVVLLFDYIHVYGHLARVSTATPLTRLNCSDKYVSTNNNLITSAIGLAKYFTSNFSLRKCRAKNLVKARTSAKVAYLIFLNSSRDIQKQWLLIELTIYIASFGSLLVIVVVRRR